MFRKVKKIYISISENNVNKNWILEEIYKNLLEGNFSKKQNGDGNGGSWIMSKAP